MTDKQQTATTGHRPRSVFLVAVTGCIFILMHTSLSHAGDRQVTLTESERTSIHHYTTPVTFQKSEQNGQQAGRKQIRSQTASHSYWINHASIGLNTDYDHDGHYSNFTVSLDVDTSFLASAVYAVLYLSLQGNQWTEFAVSSNFTIRGSNPNDTYTIDANLDSGYPSGYYDQYIEIYDAHSHELLLGHGPGDSPVFHALPFESNHHDHRFTLSSDITLRFSGTGTSGLPLIIPLIVLWGYRRFRKTTNRT